MTHAASTGIVDDLGGAAGQMMEVQLSSRRMVVDVVAGSVLWHVAHACGSVGPRVGGEAAECRRWLPRV